MTTAADIMHRPVDWVTQVSTLRQVANVMIAKAYSQMPVRDGEENVGRVTDGIICLVLEEKPPNVAAKLTVGELPKSARPFEVVDAKVSDKAVLKILEHEQALLVRVGKFLRDWGIITRADFVRQLL